jgi:tetracycline 7-halogenase / FADH2 O2-dependent halogenase
LNSSYDIAVVGSGFAGSLIAMIARRLGRSVVLLEKGKHPRFAIGESSTPLANLLLENLADSYDLPRIKSLSKWGTWQESYPNITCGMKRGFTFYHHRPGQPQGPDPDRQRQLLVAASPHNNIADTHWLRSEFDEMLVHEAQSMGIDYFDEIKLNGFIDDGEFATLGGTRNDQSVTFRAKFVVDATGPRGFLHRTLNLPERSIPNYPSTQALFSHFTNVKRLDNALPHSTSDAPPYPVDDAAVHHIFDGGWIWVLRFNNGITSAGVAATDEAFARLQLADGEAAWKQLLKSIPELQEQFFNAKTERTFTHARQLSFLSKTMHGQRWTLLPSAAGFIDPLLSTGFPLTLLGIRRLGEILQNDWGTPRFHTKLQCYEDQTSREFLAASRLLSGMYANMNCFPVFTALSLLYFASASFSETAMRLNKGYLATSFLLHDHPVFGPTSSKLLERSHHLFTTQEADRLIEDVLQAIEPIDVAGLCNRQRRNWYPVNAQDLLQSAHKVEATRDEILRLLQSCGFYQ